MDVQKILLNEKRNVTLTAYLQETEGEYRYVIKRPAVLILPGGGYQACSDREADPVAFPYLKAGYQVFILRYSVKEDAVWPNPLDDYEIAMELIRSKEEEWKLFSDKIAVIGFSAGGHLAACASTMAKNKPNAAILGYAVTIGEDVKLCNPSAPDVITAVDDQTCPCFLFSTRTDSVVPIENTIKFMEALNQYNISFESHIYAFGPHGFSTGDTSIQSLDTEICTRVPKWVEDSIGWLRDVLGEFGNGTMLEPVCKAHVNDDYKVFLSVDCTMGNLLGNPETANILKPLMNNLHIFPGASEDVVLKIIRNMKLRELMTFGGAPAPEELIESMNKQLSTIPYRF